MKIEVKDYKDISLGELLLLISLSKEIDLNEAEKGLLLKGLITVKRNPDLTIDGWRVTNKGVDVINDCIIESNIESKEPSNLPLILKELYPKGKKPGTNMYWSDGLILIQKRLDAFELKYGKYSDEDIIDATKRYLASFNGYYTNMRLLKYFILKEERKNGLIESNSDLLNWIENKQEDLNDQINEDFMSELK